MSERTRQNEDTGKPRAGGATRNPGAHLDRDWPAYFDAVENNPARDTLLLALDLFDKEGGPDGRLAIDLGAGSGRDTIAMLARGWHVTAIDGSADGISRLTAKAGAEPGAALRLIAVEARFEQMDLSRIAPDGAALINASVSLPFCQPEHFGRVWGQIVEALRRGASNGRAARFSGHFFGDRDGWSHIPARSHQTRAEVDAMLSGFDLERFEEIEKDGKDAFGNPKHYHIFNVVARLGGTGVSGRGGGGAS